MLKQSFVIIQSDREVKPFLTYVSFVKKIQILKQSTALYEVLEMSTPFSVVVFSSRLMRPGEEFACRKRFTRRGIVHLCGLRRVGKCFPEHSGNLINNEMPGSTEVKKRNLKIIAPLTAGLKLFLLCSHAYRRISRLLSHVEFFVCHIVYGSVPLIHIYINNYNNMRAKLFLCLTRTELEM